MREELDKKLCEKYPKIFAQRHMSMRDTCMCWGFTCGEGWYDLIDILCGAIQHYLDNHKDVEQVEATQVKEKYGGLRFYIQGGDEVTQAYIDFAEDMSFRICEDCGNPGGLRKKGNWYTTLCNKHNKIWQKRGNRIIDKALLRYDDYKRRLRNIKVRVVAKLTGKKIITIFPRCSIQ